MEIDLSFMQIDFMNLPYISCLICKEYLYRAYVFTKLC